MKGDCRRAEKLCHCWPSRKYTSKHTFWINGLCCGNRVGWGIKSHQLRKQTPETSIECRAILLCSSKHFYTAFGPRGNQLEFPTATMGRCQAACARGDLSTGRGSRHLPVPGTKWHSNLVSCNIPVVMGTHTIRVVRRPPSLSPGSYPGDTAPTMGIIGKTSV